MTLQRFNGNQEFRIGFLIDEPNIRSDVSSLLTFCATHPKFSTCLIRNSFSEKTSLNLRRRMRGYGVTRIASKGAFRFVMEIEGRILGCSNKNQTIKASEWDEAISINPLPSPRNIHYRYDSADLAKLRVMDLDLLIRGDGRGILKGEILSIAKHGIVSVHHGDNRMYRGGPPGFWEVLHKEERVGFVIQRLTEQVDGGFVLARGSVEACSSASINFSRVAKAAHDRFCDLLDFFAAHGKLPEHEPQFDFVGRYTTTPGVRDIARYVWRSRLGIGTTLGKS